MLITPIPRFSPSLADLREGGNGSNAIAWSSTERSTSIALFLNDRFFGQFGVNRNHRAYYGFMVLFFLIKSKCILQSRKMFKIFEYLQIKFLKRTKRNFRLQLNFGERKLCLLCNSYIFRLNEF